MTITEIEQAAVAAMKSHDVVISRTLRLLLSRLKNERIAAQRELSDADIISAVQSEYKKRKEAALEFEKGGRPELAKAEIEESEVLLGYLPVQKSEAEIMSAIESMAQEHSWTAKDFGVAMKILKEHFGATADGAVLAKLLKEKLK